jgi:hypothetical protein
MSISLLTGPSNTNEQQQGQSEYMENSNHVVNPGDAGYI